MNKVTGELHIYAQRHIVAEVGDDPNEISLEEARKIDPRYEVDDIVETEVTPRNWSYCSTKCQTGCCTAYP